MVPIHETVCEHVYAYILHILVYSLGQEVILVDHIWEDVQTIREMQ